MSQGKNVRERKPEKSQASTTKVSKKDEEGNTGVLHTILEKLSNPFLNIALTFLLPKLLKSFIDLSAPETVTKVRNFFILSQLLMLGFLFYIRAKILSSEDAREKEAVLVETPANPFTGEPAQTVRHTVRSYDIQELFTFIKGTLMTLVVFLLLNRFFGVIQPLLAQSILPWKNMLVSPVLRLRFWGQKSVGNLSRPFPSPASFLNMLQPEQPAETSKPTNITAEDESVRRAQEEFGLIEE